MTFFSPQKLINENLLDKMSTKILKLIFDLKSIIESPRTSPQQDPLMDDPVPKVIPPIPDQRYKDSNHSANATTRSLPTVSESIYTTQLDFFQSL